MVLKHDQIASQCSLPPLPLFPPGLLSRRTPEKNATLLQTSITTEADIECHAVCLYDMTDISLSAYLPLDNFHD